MKINSKISISILTSVVSISLQSSANLSVENYSVSIDDVLAAEKTCRFYHSEDLATQIKSLRSLYAVKGQPKESKRILGQFPLVNEDSKLVDGFENMVTQKNFWGEKSKDYKPDFSARINPGCDKVWCHLDSLFGPEKAASFLYLFSFFNLNASPLAYEEVQEPTQNEISSWVQALEFVPPHLTHFDRNRRISRVLDSIDGKGAYANAVMMFYKIWGKAPEKFRVFTSYHEFSHNFASNYDFNLDESDDWLALSGWVNPDLHSSNPEQRIMAFRNWDSTKANVFVSKYAATNPAEDFAETSSAFRFNPKKLQHISMGKYNFMKYIVYGGAEFIEKTCPSETHQLEKFQMLLDSQANSLQKKLSGKLNGVCFNALLSSAFLPNDKSSNERSQFCVTGEAIKDLSQSLYGFRAIPLSLYDKTNRRFLLNRNLDATSHISEFKKYIIGFCPLRRKDITEEYVEKLGKTSLAKYYENSIFGGMSVWDRYEIERVLKDLCPAH